MSMNMNNFEIPVGDEQSNETAEIVAVYKGVPCQMIPVPAAAEPPIFPAIPVQPAPLTSAERQDPRLVADYERRLNEYQTVSKIIAERDELAAMVGLLLQHLTETEYSTQTGETYGAGGWANRERRITEARALLQRLGLPC